MKLTEAKLKKLIIEAMNSKLAILKLTVGDVILDIPKGFYKKKIVRIDQTPVITRL